MVEFYSELKLLQQELSAKSESSLHGVVVMLSNVPGKVAAAV